MANMEEYLWMRCKFTKPSISMFSLPENTERMEEILEKFYLLIFPVFTKELTRFDGMIRVFWPNRLMAKHLEPPHSLVDIINGTKIKTVIPMDDGFKLGTKIGYLLDNNIGNAKDIIYDKVFEGLGRFLNTPSSGDAIRLLSRFSYGNDFFFDKNELGKALPYVTETNDPHLERKILQIYKMATESAEELGYSASRSMLAWCSWKMLGDCWTKVASETGICHTSYRSGGFGKVEQLLGICSSHSNPLQVGRWENNCR